MKVDLTKVIEGVNNEPVIFGTVQRTVEKEVEGKKIRVPEIAGVTHTFKSLALSKILKVRINKNQASLGKELFDLAKKLESLKGETSFTAKEIDLLMEHGFYGSDVVVVGRAKELFGIED